MERRRIGTFISLALSTVLLFSLIAACSNAEKPAPATEPAATNNETKKEPSADPVELTYWVQLAPQAASSVQNLNETEMYKQLEAKTGVKVDFKHPSTDYTAAHEQFNLMIASNDLTDVIEYNWQSYPGGPEKALSDGVIIRLNELIDEHAPNLKKIMDENPIVAKQMKTDNGDIYRMPYVNTGQYRAFGGAIIRKDWLDELGLSMPETIADWENVLRAFKEKKGAKAPLTFIRQNIGDVKSFMEAFGVTGVPQLNFYLDDSGKVTFGGLHDGYKQFLETFNRWYEEGLIDTEFSTNDSKAVDGKITNNEAGAVLGYIGGGIGKYLDAMKETNPEFDLALTPLPVLNKGDKPKFLAMDPEVNSQASAAITSKNQHPAETVKWLDYLYSEEGHLLKNFGVEGLTYTMVDGYPTYTDLILKNPDGLSVANAMGKYFRANYPSPGMSDDRYLEQYYAYPQQKAAVELLGTYAEYANQFMLPPLSHTAEESDELSQIINEVKTYTEESMLKFIMGGESLDQFGKYVDQIKKLDIEKAIAIKQAALDRYNVR